MQKWKGGTVQMSFIRLLPNFHFYLKCPELDAYSFQINLCLLRKMQQESMEFTRFFRQIPISYNANSWKEDCFISAAKGQEFVFEANDNALEWIKDIIQ